MIAQNMEESVYQASTGFTIKYKSGLFFSGSMEVAILSVVDDHACQVPENHICVRELMAYLVIRKKLSVLIVTGSSGVLYKWPDSSERSEVI